MINKRKRKHYILIHLHTCVNVDFTLDLTIKKVVSIDKTYIKKYVNVMKLGYSH